MGQDQNMAKQIADRHQASTKHKERQEDGQGGNQARCRSSGQKTQSRAGQHSSRSVQGQEQKQARFQGRGRGRKLEQAEEHRTDRTERQDSTRVG